MTFKICLGVVAAALLAAGSARAGALDVLYWGHDSHASVVIDGQTYDLNALDDWVTIKNVASGAHTLTLYANGTSISQDLNFTRDNADSTTGDYGPTWCIDLEDDSANLLDGATCEEMMGAYFGE